MQQCERRRFDDSFHHFAQSLSIDAQVDITRGSFTNRRSLIWLGVKLHQSSIQSATTYTNPSRFPSHPTPANDAVTPENTINDPYPLPYANPSRLFHSSELTRAPLRGPDITDPTPLPAVNSAMTRPVSTGCVRRTELLQPDQVAEKPPAKSP
ncbi:hypothetical protein NLG97_g8648 [Lecanicillium saksenae]|uniref:Uncharacterized protein n=1 Tax=Lecanicillium saksenae TaxID=468837 RepID=A0ACC1QJI6_9HYPO|nr:hypothetical protein NLG97_g8648 [Lecanicillium saksenae]